MKAQIVKFPNRFLPAIRQDRPCVVVRLTVVRIERDINLPVFITAKNLKTFIPSELSATSSIERECPKVQELRRQSKLLREHFKPKCGM